MNDEEIEFGNYGRIARRGWWVLAVGAVVGVLLAIFLLPGQNNFFESRVSVLLVPGDSDNAQGQDLINEDTEIVIAVSRVIGDQVVTQVDGLELDEWSENLVASACVTSENLVLSEQCSSQIIEFSYQGDTAEQAESVVLLTAETYLGFRQDREQALRSETVANLEEEFDGLEARSDAERAAFLANEENPLEADLIERRLREIEDTKLTVISQLTELRSRTSDVGSLLGAPTTPEADSTGIPRLFAIIAGILVGLMLGAVAAIGLDRLDRRVGDADELEQDLGTPIFGDIPRITQDSPALVTAVSAHTPGAEAFRRVAAAALATRNGVMVSSIAIVGANENEGRTTTTINLALAIAQTGREVLVVNTDRRNIVIDRIFGIVGDAGLNDYLRSQGDASAAAMAIEGASHRLGIRVLATGTGSESSLSSSGLQALIAAAKERNMIVVFDTPPALTHAGGLQIAAMADAVYVVAAAGRTRRSELAELRTQLDNVQANLSGAIFNRTSRLSLLPAGHGEIASIAIPSGVPGNVKGGARIPFDTNLHATSIQSAEEVARTEAADRQAEAVEVPTAPEVAEVPKVVAAAPEVEVPAAPEAPSVPEVGVPNADEVKIAAASDVAVPSAPDAPSASSNGLFGGNATSFAAPEAPDAAHTNGAPIPIETPAPFQEQAPASSLANGRPESPTEPAEVAEFVNISALFNSDANGEER